jgi:hypothetical protein
MSSGGFDRLNHRNYFYDDFPRCLSLSKAPGILGLGYFLLSASLVSWCQGVDEAI